MSTIAPHIEKKNFLLRYMEKSFEEYLPRRVKRLIYISSIIGLIQETTNPDKVLIEKLNFILKLAKNSDAFLFPIYIKSFIWKTLKDTKSINTGIREVDINKLDTISLLDIELMSIGNFFTINVPKWLRYGSDDLLKSDAINLVKQLHELKIT